MTNKAHIIALLADKKELERELLAEKNLRQIQVKKKRLQEVNRELKKCNH
jgi:hypothetical protein